MVISPLIWVMTTATLLMTPLITTHEPPSKGSETFAFGVVGFSVDVEGL